MWSACDLGFLPASKVGTVWLWVGYFIFFSVLFFPSLQLQNKSLLLVEDFENADVLTWAGSDPFVGKPLEGLYRSLRRLQLVWLRTGFEKSFGTDPVTNEEEGPVWWELSYKPWKLICWSGWCWWVDETLLPFPCINPQLMPSFLSLACVENYFDNMSGQLKNHCLCA